MTGTLYPLTLPDALAGLRIDLSDLDSDEYRWSDQALLRAIDRAVERISAVSPRPQAMQMAVTAGSNLYPSPPNSFYVDRVEYPLGRIPRCTVRFVERKSPLIPSPDSNTTLLSLTPGGSLASGVYAWAFSYVCPGGGETACSPPITAAVLSGQRANLSAIPTGPRGIIARNVYRSAVNGSALRYAGQIADNSTTTFVDTVSDSALGSAAPTGNSTADIDLIELQLPPELWPGDSSQAIEIGYATRHQLDAYGTSLPERHWDCLFLGALAHAMRSYLPQVNDNFEYADGHLRDRVDDTKSTVAWQTQCSEVMTEFEARLSLIKEESNAGITAITQWGDIPLRWERL